MFLVQNFIDCDLTRPAIAKHLPSQRSRQPKLQTGKTAVHFRGAPFPLSGENDSGKRGEPRHQGLEVGQFPGVFEDLGVLDDAGLVHDERRAFGDPAHGQADLRQK